MPLISRRQRDEEKSKKKHQTKKRKRDTEESEGDEEAEKGSEHSEGEDDDIPERNVHIDVPLSEQNPNLFIRIPGCVVGIGAPGTGKTQMGRYFLAKMAQYLEHVTVICMNPDANNEWDCVPKDCILGEYSDEIIEKLMEYQKANGFPLCGLFIDDPIGKATFTGKAIKDLVTKFRKYKVFLWWGIQYVNGTIPPVIRACFYQAYLFRTSEKLSAKAVKDAFLSMWFKNEGHYIVAQTLLPKHHCFFVNQIADPSPTLNIVCGPDPKLPWNRFFITWEKKPEKTEDEKGEEIEPGTIAATFKRVEAGAKKQDAWQKEHIVPVQNLMLGKKPPRPTRETVNAAHGRATRTDMQQEFAQYIGDDDNPEHIDLQGEQAAVRDVSRPVAPQPVPPPLQPSSILGKAAQNTPYGSKRNK